MGSATYRSLPGALAYDAYYRDEWGVINDATNCSRDASEREGFHKNRFTTASVNKGTVSETGDGWRFEVSNRADPKTNKALKDKSNPVPANAPDKFTLQLFGSTGFGFYGLSRLLSGKAWTEEVSVSLFFAVEHEFNRHGLRSFIARSPGLQVVILVPGIEPDPGDPRYAQAIDTAQIEAALLAAFGLKMPWKLRVISGFSTGSCGVNQTLLNELVPLGDVRRLVFYDCLYGNQCGNTANAIKRLKERAGGDLRIVVYQTSEAGNSFTSNGSQLAVVSANLGLIDSRGIVANLFQNSRYIALVTWRALEGAVNDGVVQLDKAQRSLFDDLATAAAGVARGSMVSRKETYEYVRTQLPVGAQAFNDWSKTNAKPLDAFAKKLGNPSAKGTFRHTLWANGLPGWGGGMGEEKHDLLLPEFGWEFLTF